MTGARMLRLCARIPLLLALLLAWAALGGLVLGGWLPRWSCALAAVDRARAPVRAKSITRFI